MSSELHAPADLLAALGLPASRLSRHVPVDRSHTGGSPPRRPRRRPNGPFASLGIFVSCPRPVRPRVRLSACPQEELSDRIERVELDTATMSTALLRQMYELRCSAQALVRARPRVLPTGPPPRQQGCRLAALALGAHPLTCARACLLPACFRAASVAAAVPSFRGAVSGPRVSRA